LNETEVSDRPLRIFQGTADDWTAIDSCREYVKRMRAAGKDVEIFEYTGAHHAFDNPRLLAARFRPEVLNGSKCLYVKGEPGRFQVLHRETGKPSNSGNPCRRRGATIGHHPAAYNKAIEDVPAFLRRVFNVSPRRRPVALQTLLLASYRYTHTDNGGVSLWLLRR
jgi:dienelactone hydrolase